MQLVSLRLRLRHSLPNPLLVMLGHSTGLLPRLTPHRPSLPSSLSRFPRWSGQQGYLQANRTRWFLHDKEDEDEEGREGGETAPQQAGWVQRYGLLIFTVVAGAGELCRERMEIYREGEGRKGGREEHVVFVSWSLMPSFPPSLLPSFPQAILCQWTSQSLPWT
jgi:general stress protein YciG